MIQRLHRSSDQPRLFRKPAGQSFWEGVGTRFLPFADAVSDELPLARLIRLSLFQISVGMCLVLLTGTLNRVMIIELGVPASIVAIMVALPLVFAPFRALIGHRSDNHRSALGWKRGPYIWFGSLLQFGGLAIMPFALLILSGDTHGPAWIGTAGAVLAFLLVGAGLHTTQTAGLALATDVAPEDKRPRVVALLYVMLLVGMLISATAYGLLLRDFTQLKLIQVIQGSALIAIVLNMIALWKQEARDPAVTDRALPRPTFAAAWHALTADPGTRRLFLAIGLGAAAFSMQDVLLEPYGAEILSMSVAGTTRLTALLAAGTIAGFALAAFALTRKVNACRLAGLGVLVGIFAFSAIIFSGPLQSLSLFCMGTALIGFAGGLFSVCTLTAVMALPRGNNNGLGLGVWGSVQSLAAGGAIAIGGVLRDGVNSLSRTGLLGTDLTSPSVGYSTVYHLEVLLLFATLVVLGPLARYPTLSSNPRQRFGLAAFPS